MAASVSVAYYASFYKILTPWLLMCGIWYDIPCNNIIVEYLYKSCTKAKTNRNTVKTGVSAIISLCTVIDPRMMNGSSFSVISNQTPPSIRTRIAASPCNKWWVFHFVLYLKIPKKCKRASKRKFILIHDKPRWGETTTNEVLNFNKIYLLHISIRPKFKGKATSMNVTIWWKAFTLQDSV